MLNLDAITPEVCLEAVLQQRNLGPEDFSHVIQGHLPAAHAGGLRLFEDAGATIVVHEDEWRHVVTNVADADEFFIRADWNFVSRAPQMLMYGDQEIARDLWCISLPGHTPGTMGILARLDQTGWVLLTSDAMFFHDTLGPPPANSPIDMDTEAWNDSINKIAAIAAVPLSEGLADFESMASHSVYRVDVALDEDLESASFPSRECRVFIELGDQSPIAHFRNRRP